MDARFLTAAAIAAFMVSGCFETEDKGGTVDFDRAALLENLADRLIIPAYERLDDSTAALKEAVEALVDSPDSARVEAARGALRGAWHAWQSASAYELGPAADDILRQRLNTFPAKAATIESNVKAGAWNLESVSNYDAKGFPALDYLLNGRGGSADSLLAALADTSTGENRGKYLKALVDEIASKVSGVREDWDPSGGNYRKTFVSRLGTDIGSSLGELVNQFNFDYELLKNARIGIPAGKKTLGILRPEQVEAYYGGYGASLARAHLDALEDLYRGRDGEADSLGFDDYLDALGTRYQDGSLADAIKARFAAARAALEDLEDPLSATVASEPGKLDKAYEELQRTVVLIKTDMPSAMSVSITYQDGDGD